MRDLETMSNNASSSPPSAFNNFASLGEASSPTFSTVKSKRHSLNILSSSTSTGPRPLHLAAGFVVGSSPNSQCLSPSPKTSDSPLGPSDNIGGDIPTSSAYNGANYSPHSSPLVVPPSLPLSPTITGIRSNSRRQSSISYISPNGHSPSHSQTNFSKRDSIDNLNLGMARSPLSSTTTFFVDAGRSGLARSSSLGRRGSNVSRSPAGEERSSTGSFVASSDLNAVNHLKERPPVTLAEKHAELLHFIAQKESKCLELRSQLAAHEAELLQLKKKWERIVNRGFEKSLSVNAPTSSTPSVPSSALSPAISTLTSDSSGINSALYFPTLTPTANAPSAIVLEGIKEGVQGMSRFLAAGFGSIAQVNGPSAPTHTKRAITPEPSTSSSAGPLPFRLSTASQRKAGGSGHEHKESQSSCSTTTSAASNATFSSLLSTSTTSSATSTASSTGSSTSTTKKSTTDGAGSDGEFGEFEDGQPRPRASLDRGRNNEKERQEHVLMVRDTGATPTMSPNPDFQRRRRKTNDGFEIQDPPNSVMAAAAVDDDMKEDFDWDDGWGELDCGAQAADQARETDIDVNKPAFSQAPLIARDGATKTHLSGLAPVSSIPGLGAVGMGVNTPSAQQMSSWVGSVGKKWGEIKGSPAFTKNQKRATLLLSDMQQSLVSALIAPTPLSSEPPAPYPTPTTASSASSFSSNAFHQQSASSSSKRAPMPRTATTQHEVSLIDDSDDESFGEGAETEDTVRLTMAAPVMVPVAVTKGSSKAVAANGDPRTTSSTIFSKAVKSEDTEDDEWNW